MNTRQILSVLLVALGTIAAILPSNSSKFRKFTRAELETEVDHPTYYLSADELAHLLIAGDPSIQLIDIRKEEKADSMLVRAINIPADSILNKKYESLLYQRVRKSVLYSDDMAQVKDAWKKLKYEGYSNVYMLAGGLQSWKDNILNPTYPGVSASQDELDLYNQRMAARQYFSGSKPLPKVEFKVILPAGGGKKRKVQGGCS